MTPINVEVTRSKVKVTVAFDAKTMYAKYLEKFMTDIHICCYEDWPWYVVDPYNFDVRRSNVKVTVAFYAKNMSAQYLEKRL